MSIDPRRTRRDFLGLVAGGSLVGLAGCTGDRSGNGTDEDPSPTATDAREEGTPTDERGTGSEDQVVRLSPLADRREVWHTGLVTVYPTDLVGWLREAARGDHTLRTHVATGQEMPDPPLQVLKNVRFVDDAGDLDGHYDLEVDAGTRYEMQAGAEQVDPPADAEVTHLTIFRIGLETA